MRALALALALAFGGAPAAAGDEPPRPIVVPRLADARAQLDHARELKLRLRGLAGAARDCARAEAVAAYRAVRRHHPTARALSAEAAFRAGELLRSADRRDEARTEFEAARDLGAGTPWGARGGLEAAHLLRGAGRLLDALEAYLAVAGEDEAEACHRDRARYWSGRVQADLGRAREARRTFERVAREALGPLERIDGFDAWASALVAEGELEGAAGVLELCYAELRPSAAERTLLGLRVAGALERMRAPARLKRAVEHRDRARREAGVGAR
ncbi:MAG: hypothetical protein H6828_05905 [Planctomycetes bacterium]|nr:hypothetical protein [Planctomycetota bacterium]